MKIHVENNDVNVNNFNIVNLWCPILYHEQWQIIWDLCLVLMTLHNRFTISIQQDKSNWWQAKKIVNVVVAISWIVIMHGALYSNELNWNKGRKLPCHRLWQHFRTTWKRKISGRVSSSDEGLIGYYPIKFQWSRLAEECAHRLICDYNNFRHVGFF